MAVIYESQSFTHSQVTELIERLPFEPQTKTLFLGQLTEEFYQEHVQFLSTPLLAIMMLMTYRDNMETPNKLAVFYDRAFNTLFQWHDATKAYSRTRTLSIDDFQKTFGMFCLLSYYRQKYDFSKSEIMSLIPETRKLLATDADPNGVFRDFTESVNLVREDGLSYVFIHRSFQEYFAAYAITNVVPDMFQRLLPKLSSRSGDTVLLMCFQMRPALVIDNYILPILGAMKNRPLQTSHSPLEVLEAAQVVYSCTRIRSKKRTNSIGLSASMYAETELFINQIGTLRRGRTKRSALMQDADSILMNTSAFGILQGLKLSNIVSIPFSVRVEDGVILVTSDKAGEKVIAEISKAVRRNSEKLEAVGTALANEIRSLLTERLRRRARIMASV